MKVESETEHHNKTKILKGEKNGKLVGLNGIVGDVFGFCKT